MVTAGGLTGADAGASDAPRVPAEWEPHAACWTAWPTHAYAWGDALPEAQREFAAFVSAIAELPGSETVRIAAAHVDGAPLCDLLPAHPRIEVIPDLPYGDIWLRDTSPVFAWQAGALSAVDFGFDGWGGKYRYPHDAEVAAAVARRAGVDLRTDGFVLEGGALEFDGAGTLLTTRSCLLDPVRNPIGDGPGLSEESVTARLAPLLGIRHVVWLQRGLRDDHTDGHIDNLARFLAPGVVVCASAAEDDPNRDVLRAIEADLRAARDADGRPLRVISVPSPGVLLAPDGERLAASYLNFYPGNRTVAVPAFGCATDAEARRVLAPWFPGRRVLSLGARAILRGGGGFHCITRQQPESPAAP